MQQNALAAMVRWFEQSSVPRLQAGKQGDAHEFLRRILEKAHPDYAKPFQL